VRRRGVTDIGDGITAVARQRRHAPPHHRELTLASGVAHNRRRIVSRERHLASAAGCRHTGSAPGTATRWRLIRGDAVEVAHSSSSPLARPPVRRRIARRDLGRAQRHQMAPLVRIATHVRAVLATHVALQLMDRRRLWPPHDVEGDGLMRVATEASDFKIEVTRKSSRPSQSASAQANAETSRRSSLRSQRSQMETIRKRKADDGSATVHWQTSLSVGEHHRR
jgi:hypothetical protein